MEEIDIGKGLSVPPPLFSSSTPWRNHDIDREFMRNLRALLKNLDYPISEKKFRKKYLRHFSDFFEDEDDDSAPLYLGNKLYSWWEAIHVPRSEYLPRIIQASVNNLMKPPEIGGKPFIRDILEDAGLLGQGEYTWPVRQRDMAREKMVEDAIVEIENLGLISERDDLHLKISDKAIPMVKKWKDIGGNFLDLAVAIKTESAGSPALALEKDQVIKESALDSDTNPLLTFLNKLNDKISDENRRRGYVWVVLTAVIGLILTLLAL